MTNVQKVQIIQPQVAQMTRTFTNPVCKQTYSSLPKIYGKKKKTRIEMLSTKQILSNEDKAHMKTRKNFTSNQSQSRSQSKKREGQVKSTKLTQNLHNSRCKKKSCSFHLYSQMQKKSRNKYSESQMRRIFLPEIRRFQLQDLESQHKVSLQGIGNRTTYGMSGLQKIIEQNDKNKSNKNSPRNDQRTKNHDSLKDLASQKKKIGILKNKHKFKPKINTSKFEIQEQSDDQRDEQLINGLNNNHRYKTQNYDSQSSPKSANTVSLTSLVFTGTKRQNTNFYDLNKSRKAAQKKLSRQGSVLSNGLFRIPQQPQYQQYLNGYNNIKDNFDIKKIAKKPRFRIQRHDKGVYFGQLDQQFRKHGQGINITQKQIFQGRYERDIKTTGCERNIDGVYVGQFKNGLRQGHGVFKWNNGQIFEGRWQNGMKNGHGIWRSPKGDYYQGQWLQNRQHGEGVFKHRTSTYKGEFKNFLKDGKGQEVFANGDRYEGSYKEGRPHGKGKYTWFKGGCYEGEFNQGMRQGHGKWSDQHGTIYEGHFQSDFKHGFGKQQYASGQRYQGQFFQGNRTSGKLFDKNNNFVQINAK